MTNRPSKLQAFLQTKVLEQLENGHYTIKEIATITDSNYYSVRNAVRSLENMGLVKCVPGYHRNVKYALGTDNGPNNIIPLINTTNGSYKLQEVIGLRHNEKPHAVNAILNLPRHVVRIMYAAIRISEGRTDAQLTLTALRSEMERDLQALKNSISVYEQILDNPSNWTPETLKRYTLDVTFNENDTRDAYAEYYEVED